MNTEKTTTGKIESENRVFGNIYVFDMFFILGFLAFGFIFKDNVYPALRVFFVIFMGLIGLFLTSKSKGNPQRMNFESIYFFITKETRVFRPYISEEEVEHEA